MNNTSTYWPFAGDNADPCIFGNSYFDVKALDEIVAIGVSQDLADGKIAGGASDNTIRDCRTRTIWPDEMPWVYARLAEQIALFNARAFRFEVDGFAEGMLFTEYTAPGNKYEYHIDQVPKGLTRKLTMVLQLSDEDAYEGGDLQLQLGHAEPFTFPRTRGTLIVFPSFYLHRVTPVTRGTRNSLVGWVTGKPFK